MAEVQTVRSRHIGRRTRNGKSEYCDQNEEESHSHMMFLYQILTNRLIGNPAQSRRRPLT